MQSAKCAFCDGAAGGAAAGIGDSRSLIQIWKYTSNCERQIKIYHVLNISRAALLLMRGPLILTFLDVPASQQCNNSDWANLLLQLTRKENLSCCGPLLRTFLFQFDFRKTLNQFINSMCKTAKLLFEKMKMYLFYCVVRSKRLNCKSFQMTMNNIFPKNNPSPG